MMQFTAIDFETASGSMASACSLGMAVVEGEEIVARREWLIRPPSMYFSPYNIDVHGITAEMVADAPEFNALWPEMERMIGGRTLVAHNAAFDMGVLRATLVHYDLWSAQMPFVCSVALARKCWPELTRHSLDALAREFGIEFCHHNAGEDAMAAARGAKDDERRPWSNHNAGEDAMAAARVVLRAAEEYSAESIEQLMERTRIRLGEVSTGAYRSCRRIPKQKRSKKLVYEPTV